MTPIDPGPVWERLRLIDRRARVIREGMRGRRSSHAYVADLAEAMALESVTREIADLLARLGAGHAPP